MKKPMYFAFIGDIVASRRLEDRDGVQRRLRAVLDGINGDFAGSIAARFLITLGDEFQGLMRVCDSDTNANAFAAAMRIIDELHPVRLRIAVGMGEMSTRILPEGAIGADGEAFHNARRCIEQLNLSHRRAEGVSPLRICTGNSEDDERINMPLMLCETIRRGWTDRQTEIAVRFIEAALRGEAVTQNEVAGELGITQSTVNVSLAASGCAEYIKGLCFAARELDALSKRMANCGG